MRVFVTGMGAISCLGENIAAHRTAFQAGASGIGPIGEGFPGLPSDGQAGLVRDGGGTVTKVERFLHQAMMEAIESAGLLPRENVAIFLGSAHGDLDAWLYHRKAGGGFSKGLWNLLGQGLDEFCANPDVTVISTACTASSVACGLAFNQLRMGEVEVAIVAGVESLTSFLYRGFESLKSLAPDGCRPFDRDRSGLTLGEGAAAIVLETEAHAVRRQAHLGVEVTGYGFAADGSHLTAPDPAGNGAVLALQAALQQSGLVGIPDFINTHGTGTRLNDRMECLALQKTFGDRAAAIPLTSTKPLTGHMCGAAGAMEIISAAISLETHKVPPILGFRQADPEFAHLNFVHGTARAGRFRTAISMNSGFGGTNTAIILQRND